MKTTVLDSRWTRTLAVLLLAAAFVACRPRPPETPPAPEPPSPELTAVHDG